MGREPWCDETTGSRTWRAVSAVAATVVAYVLMCGVAVALDTSVSAVLGGADLSISAAPGHGTFAGTLDGRAHAFQGVGFTSFTVPGRVGFATIDNTTGAIIASCTAAGQGMGSYEFSAPSGAWMLAVTADEFAGTYASTLTTTVAVLALQIRRPSPLCARAPFSWCRYREARVRASRSSRGRRVWT